MVMRRPVLFKTNVSSRCPDSLTKYYRLKDLSEYIGESSERILDNCVNGGNLIHVLSEFNLVIANCDCGNCLGDHLVQDMGTIHWISDGPTMKIESIHPRQWHAHNCILAFDWRFFLDPKIVENVYIPQSFGDELMRRSGKIAGRYGDSPEARIGRSEEISSAFWNIADSKDDPKLCWDTCDVPALGNANRVPVL